MCQDRPEVMPPYYRSVKGYHRCVEEGVGETFIVPPAVIRRFMHRGAPTIDIAGGFGINARILDIDAARYVCVDLSMEGLSIAVEKRRGACILADVRVLPLKNDSAGNILCSWSLEHMTDPGAVLREMIRILRPGGRMIIWGPNWDNIFRKDFPQYAHRRRARGVKARLTILRNMLRNEFGPFSYRPYIDTDVAALAEPGRYLSGDTDAVHCVLCQETVKFLERSGLRLVHLSDLSEMGKHVRNDAAIRALRQIVIPLLPLLRRLPLMRWFVIRFPVVVEKPVLDPSAKTTHDE